MWNPWADPGHASVPVAAKHMRRPVAPPEPLGLEGQLQLHCCCAQAPQAQRRSVLQFLLHLQFLRNSMRNRNLRNVLVRHCTIVLKTLRLKQKMQRAANMPALAAATLDPCSGHRQSTLAPSSVSPHRWQGKNPTTKVDAHELHLRLNLPPKGSRQTRQNHLRTSPRCCSFCKCKLITSQWLQSHCHSAVTAAVVAEWHGLPGFILPWSGRGPDKQAAQRSL